MVVAPVRPAITVHAVLLPPRPCVRRHPHVFVALLVALMILLTGGCSSGGAGSLSGLAAVIPRAVADEGLLLRRGGAGYRLLATAVGVDLQAVQATATTTAPALRVLSVHGGESATVLARVRDAGYEEVPSDVQGWSVLRRRSGVPGITGVPALAVSTTRDDLLVAVGDVDQLQQLMAGGATLDLPDAVIADAALALVVSGTVIDRGATSTGFAGALPAYELVVATVADDGASGRLALVLQDGGSQQDAVALAVRIRTEGPLDAEGDVLLDVGDALTTADVAVVDVTWREPADRLLRHGLDGRLLTFLGR